MTTEETGKTIHLYATDIETDAEAPLVMVGWRWLWAWGGSYPALVSVLSALAALELPRAPRAQRPNHLLAAHCNSQQPALFRERSFEKPCLRSRATGSEGNRERSRVVLLPSSTMIGSASMAFGAA